MHPRTLEIRDFETQSQADAQGFTVPLAPAEAEELRSMSRKQRRAWLKANGKSKAQLRKKGTVS